MTNILMHWRNSWHLCVKMTTKNMLLLGLATLWRGYDALLRSMLVPCGLLLGLSLLLIVKHTKMRIVWWFSGYMVSVVTPLAAIAPYSASLSIALLHALYFYQWALAVRASVGKKDFHYFRVYHTDYWRIFLVHCCITPLIFVYGITYMSNFFIKEYLLGVSLAVCGMVTLYLFSLLLLFWILLWFVWFAADDRADVSWVMLVRGMVSFVVCNIPMGFFLMITACIWSVCWYGLLWGFLQIMSLMIPSLLHAVPVITAIWVMTYSVVYPGAIAWLYMGYVITRYSCSDRYVILFGDYTV